MNRRLRAFLSMGLLLIMSTSTAVAAVPGTAAAAPPPTPVFGPAIDPIPVQAPYLCAPVERPGTRALADLLKNHYGHSYSGLTRACGAEWGDAKSAHQGGRAIDWDMNYFDAGHRAMANEVINWLLATDQYGNRYANARRLGVAQIIWNQRSWRATSGATADQSTWAICYTGGKTCGSSPHQDHMHFTLSADGADKRTSWWSGGSVPVPEIPDNLVGAPAQPYNSGLGVYIRGTNGHLYQKAYNNGSWSGWLDLEGDITGTPVAVEYDGVAHVFARGVNGALYQKKYENGVWSGWINHGGNITGSPSVVEYNGALHVFATGVGADADLFQLKYDGQWSSWINLDGTITGSPTVLPYHGGLGVYARGINGHLYHRSYNSGSWSAWIDLGGNITGASISAVEYNDDVHVFVRGTNNELYQKKYDNGQWSGWIQHLGAISDSPEALVFHNGLGVYAQGVNGHLYTKSFNAGAWTGWIDLGGDVTGTPVAVDYNDAASIFIRGVNGVLYQKKYFDGQWSWVNHGGEMTAYYDS